MSSIVQVDKGTGPVVLGIPHTGTHIPEPIWEQLDESGRAKADTDWHVERLYEGLLPNVTTVRATIHRYAIDANRDPEGGSLYPGQNTTGLCPLTDFDGRPIYRDGAGPAAAEIARRVREYHAPYHDALRAQVERIRALHGVAILYDCHSIRACIPYLFDGVLPDLSIGTDGGRSCAPEVEAAVVERCAASGYRHVLNGRFKGGWTTRHYGRPAEGVHAVQMEIAQSTYMDDAPPWTWREERAAPLRQTLRTVLERLAALAPQLGGTA
jgi:formiminoglutamase